MRPRVGRDAIARAVGLGLGAALLATVATAQPPTARPPADQLPTSQLSERPTAAVQGTDSGRSPSLYTAWLEEMMHADPQRAVAAYRSVADDTTLPREERLVALARILPLAAQRQDQELVASSKERVVALLGRPNGDTIESAARRCQEIGDALRAALRSSPTNPDLDAITAAYERTRGTPAQAQALRGFGGADSLPEVQRRMLRAAEEKGDTVEAGRLRRQMAANQTEGDGRSPRMRQVQRWARDAIESELAGQHDKAARLRANLALLRTPGRSPAVIAERFERAPERLARVTIDRLQTLFASGRDLEPVSERERDAARRALEEARRRFAAGDLDGAVALLWPAAVLMRTAD